MAFNEVDSKDGFSKFEANYLFRIFNIVLSSQTLCLRTLLSVYKIHKLRPKLAMQQQRTEAYT